MDASSCFNIPILASLGDEEFLDYKFNRDEIDELAEYCRDDRSRALRDKTRSDDRALQRLIYTQRGYLKKICGRCIGFKKGQELDSIGWAYDNRDIYQAGRLGIVKACDRYDRNVGRFGSYACWWMRMYIQRMGMNLKDRILTSRQADEFMNMKRKIQRDPKFRAIVERHTSKDGIKFRLMLRAKNVKSIQASRANLDTSTDILGRSSVTTLGRVDPGYNVAELIIDSRPCPLSIVENQLAIKESVTNVINSMTPNARQVLTIKYGLKDGVHKTNEEVARKLGITRERVRQIEQRAFQLARENPRFRDVMSA